MRSVLGRIIFTAALMVAFSLALLYLTRLIPGLDSQVWVFYFVVPSFLIGVAVGGAIGGAHF